MAHKLGVQSPLEPVPSIGLGSNAVSPLDMASAYATLAAGGIYSQPMAIRKVILANGKEDDQAGWGKPVRKRVISDGVAYTVTKILEQNVQYGTGTRANFGRPAAGKTGDDRQPRRRLVLRLPAEPRGDGLGRVPAGRDPDGERARDRRRRRQLPGGDLAALHGARDALLAGAGLPAAEDLSGLEVLPARPVRDPVRLDRHDQLDHDRDDDHGREDDHGRAGDDDRAGDDPDRQTNGAGDDGAADDDRPTTADHPPSPTRRPTTTPPPTDDDHRPRPALDG